MQDSKDLEMIKGYVARLYTLVRSRTEITLELSEGQAEEFSAVGDTIEDINTIINNSIEENKDYLIRNFSTKYSLENITLLQDIDSSFNTTKYKLVEIKNIELLNNKSFLRLYDLILSLYGNQIINKNKNIYMELLINSLFNTSEDEDKLYLEVIFIKYDWKQGNKISFLKSASKITNSPSNFFTNSSPYFSYKGIKHSPSDS